MGFKFSLLGTLNIGRHKITNKRTMAEYVRQFSIDAAYACKFAFMNNNFWTVIYYETISLVCLDVLFIFKFNKGNYCAYSSVCLMHGIDSEIFLSNVSFPYNRKNAVFHFNAVHLLLP